MPPMISYAQNHEDVILNRIFTGKKNGFYIDVGAHDPEHLSVTKHFYNLGWRGINIEPVPSSYEKFMRGRPEDINVNMAVGDGYSLKTFYEFSNKDHSTLSKQVAENTSKRTNQKFTTYKVEVRTLKEICDTYCNSLIDFMKIDVEGLEAEVIKGADFKKYRPVVIVIESTEPLSNPYEAFEAHSDIIRHDIESALAALEYELVYFDGLNQFFLRNESANLRGLFSFPVSYYDYFIPVGQARAERELDQLRPAVAELQTRVEDQDAKLNEAKELAKAELDQANSTFASERDALVAEKEALAASKDVSEARLAELEAEEEQLLLRFQEAEALARKFERGQARLAERQDELLEAVESGRVALEDVQAAAEAREEELLRRVKALEGVREGIRNELRQTYRRHSEQEERKAALAGRVAALQAKDMLILTSIAPKRIELQQKTIKTWLDQGFAVVSLNCPEEVAVLSPKFPEVLFYPAHRDARESFNIPLVYLSDMLKVAKSRFEKCVGIVNSDVALAELDTSTLVNLVDEGLVYGRRIDVKTPEDRQGDLFTEGFDIFFMGRHNLDLFMADEFCLGRCWWDFYIPLVALLRGMPCYMIQPEVAFHVEHPRWALIAKDWYELGRVLSKLVGDMLKKGDVRKKIPELEPHLAHIQDNSTHSDEFQTNWARDILKVLQESPKPVDIRNPRVVLEEKFHQLELTCVHARNLLAQKDKSLEVLRAMLAEERYRRNLGFGARLRRYLGFPVKPLDRIEITPTELSALPEPPKLSIPAGEIAAKIEPGPAAPRKNVRRIDDAGLLGDIFEHAETASAVFFAGRETNLRTVPSVELAFCEEFGGGEVIDDVWLGLVNTPTELPEWLLQAGGIQGFTAKKLFASQPWLDSKQHCMRLGTFTSRCAAEVKKLSGVETELVPLPLETEVTAWSPERFRRNPLKRIVQPADWQQRMHAVFMLPESDFEKVLVRSRAPFASRIMDREREVLSGEFAFFDHMYDTALVLDPIGKRETDEMLSANVALAHYYDVCAPNLILKCMARATPLLVNPLPVVIDLLGREYPLYYYFYADAVEKAQDEKLLVKAHEYLKALNERVTDISTGKG